MDYAADGVPHPRGMFPTVGQLRIAVVATAAILAASVLALVGVTITKGATDTTPAALQSSGSNSPGPSGANGLSGVPGVLVAMTTAGGLTVLDPLAGTSVRTLLSSGAVGDEIALSPDQRTVFFTRSHGCLGQIATIPVAGGGPTALTDGSLPAISPDGTKLAFTRQQSLSQPGCVGATAASAGFAVVVRSLRTGHETKFPISPRYASGLPVPISHLSWAPDNRRLAISITSTQDNQGWNLVVMDTTSDTYYDSPSNLSVPVTGDTAAQSYYSEGVFLPDGNLFVSRTCCSGVPPITTSVLLEEVMVTTGAEVQRIAVGYTDRAHDSLDADQTGSWLLYLSGHDLMTSKDGQRPSVLATGLSAADW
jgi:hypothetical protein